MYRTGLLAVCVLAPMHSAIADLSWYVGAGGSYSTLQTKGFAQNPGTTGPFSSGVTTGEFDDGSGGWQIFGGLMFTENFGVSLKYSDSGTGRDQWNGLLSLVVDPGPPPVTSETDLTFDGEMGIEGIWLYFIQTVPISEKLECSLELGVTRQDFDFTWSETSGSGLIPGTVSVSDDDTGFAFGGLVRYKFMKNFAISGEIEYATPDFGDRIDRPLRFSLNGEFHF